jgi:hypothetical protein
VEKQKAPEQAAPVPPSGRRKKGRENELGELQLGVHVGSSGEEQEEEEEERGKFRNKLGRHAAST